MRRSTKVLFLPCARHTRKFVHDLDRNKKRGYLYDLQKQMEREVPRPNVISRGGKWVKYEGP